MSLPLILIAAAITGGAIAYVVSPLLWRETERGAGATPDDEKADLLARRDAAYAAIRELDDDHRLGKLEPDAYRVTRAQLEEDAARILQALDALTPVDRPRASDGVTRRRRQTGARRRVGVAR